MRRLQGAVKARDLVLMLARHDLCAAASSTEELELRLRNLEEVRPSRIAALSSLTEELRIGVVTRLMEQHVKAVGKYRAATERWRAVEEIVAKQKRALAVEILREGDAREVEASMDVAIGRSRGAQS